MEKERESQNAPYLWYGLLFLAVVVCFVIPIGMLLQISYQGGAVSRESAVSPKTQKVAPAESVEPKQAVAEKTPTAGRSEPKSSEKSRVPSTGKQKAPQSSAPSSTGARSQKSDMKQKAPQSSAPSEAAPSAKSARNTPPQAVLKHQRNEMKFLEYDFDASECRDDQDPPSELLVRWDFDGDGTWETEYSKEKVLRHVFSEYGRYRVSLEVKDKAGAVDVASVYLQNHVPELKLSSHPEPQPKRCMECHHIYTSQPACPHAQRNRVCMDCHQHQIK